MCFLEVALHEDFKYSFIVITDEIDIPWSGNISKLTNFLQFKYNKHFIIVYGIGHMLYGVVPIYYCDLDYEEQSFCYVRTNLWSRSASPLC